MTGPFFDNEPYDPAFTPDDQGLAGQPLLDHGYIKLIETWGTDQRIVESARMSTSRSFVSWDPYKRCERCDAIEWEHLDYLPTCPGFAGHAWKVFPKGDMGILGYLWKNAHTTPFEMAGLTIEVQAPIFVFREWHRHRVPFGYSELSARYSPMPALDYVPTVERMLAGGGHLTKQAGPLAGSGELSASVAESWLIQLQDLQANAQLVYQTGLNVGVPKELARLAVTVGRYSRMRATGNLRGWLAFNKLRFAPTAQHEIRVFAEVVDRYIQERFPRTHQVVHGERP